MQPDDEFRCSATASVVMGLIELKLEMNHLPHNLKNTKGAMPLPPKIGSKKLRIHWYTRPTCADQMRRMRDAAALCLRAQHWTAGHRLFDLARFISHLVVVRPYSKSELKAKQENVRRGDVHSADAIILDAMQGVLYLDDSQVTGSVQVERRPTFGDVQFSATMTFKQLDEGPDWANITATGRSR